MAERGRFGWPDFRQAHLQESFALCSITASELLHGWERAKDSKIKAKRGAFVEGLLSKLAIVPFGLEEARRHARLWAGLEAQGQVIGSHDLMIAATAVSLNFSLATLNRKEFKRVPGLSLIKVDSFLIQAK